MNIPSIISAAAQSLLGIIALSIIVLSLIALRWFSKESVKVKSFIFLLMFSGFFAFFVAVLYANSLVTKPDNIVSNENFHQNALLVESATEKYKHPSRPANTSKSSEGEKIHTKDSLVEKELYDKNLFKKLQDAGTRLNPENDSEVILRLYRDILFQLSPEARGKLDQSLLISSDNEYQAGRNFSAVSKYRQLFNDYL